MIDNLYELWDIWNNGNSENVHFVVYCKRAIDEMGWDYVYNSDYNDVAYENLYHILYDDISEAYNHLTSFKRFEKGC